MDLICWRVCSPATNCLLTVMSNNQSSILYFKLFAWWNKNLENKVYLWFLLTQLDACCWWWCNLFCEFWNCTGLVSFRWFCCCCCCWWIIDVAEFVKVFVLFADAIRPSVFDKLIRLSSIFLNSFSNSLSSKIADFLGLVVVDDDSLIVSRFELLNKFFFLNNILNE